MLDWGLSTPLNSVNDSFYVTISVNGGFTPWSDFTPCSKSCGGGMTRKARTCKNPAPAHGGEDCKGDNVQAKSCNEQPCPGEFIYLTTLNADTCEKF